MCVLDPGPYLEVAVEPGADDDPELPCTRPVRGSGSHASQLRLGAKVTLVAPLGGETGQVLGHLIAREGLRTSTVGTGDANGSVIDDRRAPGAEPIDVPGHSCRATTGTTCTADTGPRTTVRRPPVDE